MPDVEAILIYRPSGFEVDGEFRLARTTAKAAILAVAKSAISEARQRVKLYEGLDPILADASRFDADRLESILRRMIPEYGEPSPPGGCVVNFKPGPAAP